jgi:hypothetical protein
MAIIDPIKSLKFLRSMGLDVSDQCKEQLKDMGYKLPEDEEKEHEKNN